MLRNKSYYSFLRAIKVKEFKHRLFKGWGTQYLSRPYKRKIWQTYRKGSFKKIISTALNLANILHIFLSKRLGIFNQDLNQMRLVSQYEAKREILYLIQQTEQMRKGYFSNLYNPISFVSHSRIKKKGVDVGGPLIKRFINFMFVLTRLNKRLKKLCGGDVNKTVLNDLFFRFKVLYKSFYRAWVSVSRWGILDAKLNENEKQQLLKFYWQGNPRDLENSLPLWIRAYGSARYSLDYFRTNPYPLQTSFVTDSLFFWHNFMVKRITLTGDWSRRIVRLSNLFKRWRFKKQRLVEPLNYYNQYISKFCLIRNFLLNFLGGDFYKNKIFSLLQKYFIKNSFYSVTKFSFVLLLKSRLLVCSLGLRPFLVNKQLVKFFFPIILFRYIIFRLRCVSLWSYFFYDRILNYYS